MDDPGATLQAIVEDEAERPVPAEVRALADHVRQRHEPAVLAVLYYGSGLRRDDRDRLVLDFYVVVDRYDRAFGKRLMAILNVLLPPNVLYLEADVEGRRLSCKYAVISLRQFARGAGRRALTPYIWARFAQPCRIVHVRDEETRREAVAALAEAPATFMARVLPLLHGARRPRDIWLAGLVRTYRTELRSEGPGRAAALYDAASPYFDRLTIPAARCSGVPVRIDESVEPPRIAVAVGRARRAAARARWLLLVPLGKALSLLRLVKSAFTFEGAVDYVLWKMERHSGVRVEATPWQRRHPLIGGWLVAWRLYRRGAFR